MSTKTLYMDVMFRPADGCGTRIPSIRNGKFTSDDEGVKNIPSFLLDPEAVLVATSDGDVEVFDDKEPTALLSGLSAYFETAPMTGNEPIVGWNLDQVVIPALCSSAFRHGICAFPKWMRKLDDKWSKTNGFSIERAFLQGWYPASHDDATTKMANITLNEAVKLAGLKKLEDVEVELGDGLPPIAKELMARVSALSSLYARYQEILAWSPA